MSQDLYHRAILEAAAAAVGAGELSRPHGHARVDNPLCGDRVDFDVSLTGAKVSALAHRVRGCVLCEAAASVIGSSAAGVTAPSVAGARAEVAAMLRGNPPVSSPRGKPSRCSRPPGIFPAGTSASRSLSMPWWPRCPMPNRAGEGRTGGPTSRLRRDLRIRMRREFVPRLNRRPPGALSAPADSRKRAQTRRWFAE